MDIKFNQYKKLGKGILLYKDKEVVEENSLVLKLNQSNGIAYVESAHIESRPVYRDMGGTRRPPLPGTPSWRITPSMPLETLMEFIYGNSAPDDYSNIVDLFIQKCPKYIKFKKGVLPDTIILPIETIDDNHYIYIDDNWQIENEALKFPWNRDRLDIADEDFEGINIDKHWDKNYRLKNCYTGQDLKDALEQMPKKVNKVKIGETKPTKTNQPSID